MKCPHCGKETEEERESSPENDAWLTFQGAYPQRRGGYRWPVARRRFAEFYKSGNDRLVISKVRAYYRHCVSEHIVGTRLVMQAATFLGDGGGWMEDWSTETPFDQARRQLQEQT